MGAKRLAPLTPGQLNEQQRALYDAVLDGPRAKNPLFAKYGMREDGSLAGPFDAWLRTPELGSCFEQAGIALRDATEVSDLAREVAILVVAAAWGAPFEWWVHSRMLKQGGASDVVIEAISQRRRPHFEDPAVKAAHDVAFELVHKRELSDATYIDAIESLGERGLVEVACAVGFYQLVSGTLESFRPPSPDEIAGPPAWVEPAGIDFYHAASTTRAVRRLRSDPVPDEVLKRIVRAATWGPSGANRQPWRVVMVKAPARRKKLADMYSDLWGEYARIARSRMADAPEASRLAAEKSLAAGDYLAGHLGEVPVLNVFCFNPELLQITDMALDRPSVVGGGSLYPAVQNFLLACRSEGLGCVLTTLLCQREADVKALLEIPEPWGTFAFVPVGYPVAGGHGPISRNPVEEMSFLDSFGSTLFDAGAEVAQ